MTTRFKFVAAMIGLFVATAATTGASAKAIDKTIVKGAATHAGMHKAVHVPTTKIIVRRPHARIGRPVVYRAPLRASLVRLVSANSVVRVIKRPILQRQVLAHRIVVRKTIIR